MKLTRGLALLTPRWPKFALTLGDGEKFANPDDLNDPTGVQLTELLGVDRADLLTYPLCDIAVRSACRVAATRARSTGSRHAKMLIAADASRSERNTPAPGESST